MQTYKRIDIQVYRGICVLAVIFFHVNPNLFKLGYLGVDAFFVISGFVLTPIFINSNFNNKKSLMLFYKSRFYRLIPGLSSFLIVMTLIFILIDPIVNHQLFSKMALSSLVNIANFAAFTLTGDYFSKNPNPLLHLWSLSLEFQIYFVFPLIFILSKRYLPVKRLIYIYMMLMVISCAIYLFPNILSNLFAAIGIQEFKNLSYYLPTHRFWQFALGGIAYICSNHQQNKSRLQKTLLSIAVVLSFILIFRDFTQAIQSIYLTIIFTLIVLSNLSIKLNILGNILQFLGDRSYSIYLFHFPILYLSSNSPIFSEMRSKFNSILILFSILLTFLLGDLNYRLIETKFKKQNITHKSIYPSVKHILIFNIIPILILSFILQVSKLNYMGLNKDIKLFPIFPSMVDKNCYEKSKVTPCVYTNASNSSRKIMLIGNSFAGHLVEVTKYVSKELNYDAIIWADLECKINIYSAINTDQDTCHNQNKSIRNYINDIDPEIVIISEFINEPNDLSRLKSVILNLMSPSRKIILIENIPIFPDEEVYMRSRPILNQIIQPRHKMDFDKTVAISKMQLNYKTLSDSLADWASKKNVETIRPWDIFCDKLRCKRYEKETWLYFDYNHLSLEGAMKLSSALIKSIK